MPSTYNQAATATITPTTATSISITRYARLVIVAAACSADISSGAPESAIPAHRRPEVRGRSSPDRDERRRRGSPEPTRVSPLATVREGIAELEQVPEAVR